MNKAVDYLKVSGLEIWDSDTQRLTPLGFDHIRLLRRYDFTLKAKPEAGGLRPLRGHNIKTEELCVKENPNGDYSTKLVV